MHLVPTQPGVYTIQTVLQDAKNEAHSNIIIVVNEQPPATISLAEFPTVTKGIDFDFLEDEPTVTPSPTITITPTQVEEKTEVTADQNLNCRRGPSTLYETVDYFYKGQTALVIGRDSNSGWLLIELNANGKECWVSQGYIKLTGDLSTVAFVTPPPLPPTSTVTQTEMPYTSCSDYPDLVTFSQDPMGFGGCVWDTGLNTCEP
jgi:hypothetical protein